jgi:hypothetical protein
MGNHAIQHQGRDPGVLPALPYKVPEIFYFMTSEVAPFIYPPTLFGQQSRTQLPFVGKYFPTNYFVCKMISAYLSPYKSSRLI